jgi:hypothetical protein
MVRVPGLDARAFVSRRRRSARCFSKIRRRSFSPFHGDWVQQFKTRGERSRKTSIVGEKILFNPIFNAQSAHSFEFPFIIRHEPNAKTQGLGRNQQIHGTNRPS